MANEQYPIWIYYPNWSEPQTWVSDVATVFAKAQSQIDSRYVPRKSNEALAIIRTDLESLGFDVEGGNKTTTIKRPVHFGEHGVADRTYRIDSYHADLKLALEVEAGRSLRGNAVYRDLIQTSLLVGVDYLALAVPQQYVFKLKGKDYTDSTYKDTKSILDAIFSSERLKLPLKGILLIGY